MKINILILLYFYMCSCTQPSLISKSALPQKTGKNVSTITNSNSTSGSASSSGASPSSSFFSSSSSSSGSSSIVSTGTLAGNLQTSTPQVSASKTINPLNATASISQNIALVSSDIVTDPNILFPQISFTGVSADYVQILRCAASYQMKTVQGVNVQKNFASLSADDLKWAWSQAVSDNHSCKIVSEYMLSVSYIDLPAPSGSFYYVANPCIIAMHSNTGQEACSFNLSFTKPIINYENLFIDKLRSLAIELAAAQDNLYALFDDVRNTAKTFEVRLNLCEEYFAFKEAQKALLRGLLLMGMMTVGAIAGGLLGEFLAPAMMGAAGGAMMGGMMIQMMGGNILSGIFNLNPALNSCLYGESIVSQMGATSQSAAQRSLIAAQDFETRFDVAATLKHLQDLVQAVDSQHPTGGLVAQAVTRMQNIIAQMNAIDQKIISVDALIARGNAYAKSQVDLMNTPSP